MSKIILKDGREFDTYKELAKFYDIRYGALMNQMRYGRNGIDDALEAVLNKKRCMESLQKEFGADTIPKVCDIYEIDSVAVYKRIRSGVSTIDAIREQIEYDRTKGGTKRKGYVDSKGNKYKTVVELAKAAGLSYTTCSTRLKRGWSVDDILNTPQQRHNTIDKTRWDIQPEVCKEYGISYKTYKNRVKSGWDNERALKTPVKSRTNGEVTYKGKVYPSLKRLCDEMDVDDFSVRYRMKNGANLEEAIDSGRNWIRLNIFGIEFLSVKRAARYFNNSNFPGVLDKLRKGWDIEVALLYIQGRGEGLRLQFIGIDGRAYYRVGTKGGLLTARELIMIHRPDMLETYDKYNPTGKYNPYIPEQRGK